MKFFVEISFKTYLRNYLKFDEKNINDFISEHDGFTLIKSLSNEEVELINKDGSIKKFKFN